MLLTLLSSQVEPGAPVFSTGNGVLCLHTTLFTDELEAAALIAELESTALSAELSTPLVTVTLTKTFTC